MTAQRIRVSSTALGPRVTVLVLVYETLTEMRAAAQAYNDTDNHDTIAVTQVRSDRAGRVGSVLVRLARGHLGTRIVTHEMHHASTAWYGATLGDRISRRAHFTHYNEPFAHLHSDLTYRLVDALYTRGFYPS